MNIRITEGSDLIKIRKLVLSQSSAYLINKFEALPEWLSNTLEIERIRI